VREFEPPLAKLVRPRERALLVAEQLALQEKLGERSAIDLDERAAAPGAGVVDGARDEILARSRLALDEDRCPPPDASPDAEPAPALSPTPRAEMSRTMATKPTGVPEASVVTAALNSPSNEPPPSRRNRYRANWSRPFSSVSCIAFIARWRSSGAINSRQSCPTNSDSLAVAPSSAARAEAYVIVPRRSVFTIASGRESMSR